MVSEALWARALSLSQSFEESVGGKMNFISNFSILGVLIAWFPIVGPEIEACWTRFSTYYICVSIMFLV